jgi:hypothetical protein
MELTCACTGTSRTEAQQDPCFRLTAFVKLKLKRKPMTAYKLM